MPDRAVRCEICGSLIDEEDLFCANCGTEAPVPSAAAQPPITGHASRIATHNFSCTGCGASMSYDAAAQALRCPFCGSTQMEQLEAESKALRPEAVVPFEVSRTDAKEILQRWLGQGFWRPADLVKEASLVDIAPVYVPYWAFSAETYTYWTADTSRTPPGARGDWFPLFGEHHGRYAGMLVGAGQALTAEETAALCPFDLDKALPPEQVDLENVTVEQFGLPRKYARARARHGLHESERAACQQRYVPGNARNVHANVRIESMAGRPVLLPVWIMAYRYRNRLYRFLINGQTGQTTGQAPVSVVKQVVAIGLVALGAMLLLWLLGQVFS